MTASLAPPEVPLRHLVTCLDGRRIPLNASERAEKPGDVPYWGAGGVLDQVDRPLFSETLVLLGEDGAPFFEPGKDVAHLVRGPVWVNNHIHVLRPHLSVDARYLTYSLNAVDYAQHISGSTRDKLTQDDMRRISVHLPALDEQRRIADFLDTETTRIEGLTSLRHRQLVMLGIRSASVAERLVLNARATWPTAPLKYLVREIDNRDGPLGELLSVSIHHGVVPRSSTTSDEPRADDLSNYKRVRADDLVLNRMRAFQGGVGVAPMSGIVSPDYTVMRATGRVRPRYLHYLFRSPWFVGQMAARLRGIGSSDQGNVRTPRVAFADLGSIYVPTPEPSAQDELTGTLDDEVARTQALISAIERQQHLLDERRQALITAAVTGQLDVTTARVGGAHAG